MKQTGTLNNSLLLVYPAEEMMSNGIHDSSEYLKINRLERLPHDQYHSLPFSPLTAVPHGP